MSEKTKTIIVAALAGAAIGAAALWVLQPAEQAHQSDASGEKKPLYWVAPMDSNYRRDKPGKSPMGMDLIPVYEEDAGAADNSAGTVTISPDVVNNLGVRTAKVVRTSLESNLLTVGYVQYDEDTLVHIHPRVEGWIEQLFVKAAGEPVSKGQPLYTLYSPQLVTAQEELLIALRRNNETLVSAAKERLQSLHLSPEFIAKLMKNRKVYQSVTFYSPQSGVVDGLQIREGFFVQPGTTLMSIGQLNEVWVEAEVFERDAALVRAGLPVTMTLDYLPGKTWQGVVDYVYPTLDAQNRTLRVRMRFSNPEHQLKPNMFAQVTIVAGESPNTLVVPKESVIRTGKQDRVVLDKGDGRFKSVAVSIGRVTGENIEILDGLAEGDVVVTSAQFLIDSESSKTSDFKRMSHDAEPDSVWMEGSVNSVMAGHRMVNITHGPAEAWNWPEMTMDFTVDESVDMDALEAGQSLHFEVTKTSGGGYRLTGIHIMQGMDNSASSATVNGVINTVDSENRVLNISRGAIEKWDRPPATMDFRVADDIDLSLLKAGMTVSFTFEVGDDFVVVAITPVDAGGHDMAGHADHSNH
ncbi:efflux RND transporter periplasmic adaptor subunit [Alteromonas aestuariivivens]|uniref:Efflux RND transporter periplasmic adaptor subunit n=1 Tax=Alteromonas aestuariivivens TaxID=1938339 RepID=A0A3D8ME39_9ALTE|nr:efflux RND transporter periplasmic adaptor subunit [Alteromonas aestuariivivens]RDV29129.1 efflux RND transporter periplasmic adaptor subunit [Alteromonas aestuariivivens]